MAAERLAIGEAAAKKAAETAARAEKKAAEKEANRLRKSVERQEAEALKVGEQLAMRAIKKPESVVVVEKPSNSIKKFFHVEPKATPRSSTHAPGSAIVDDID